MKSHSNFFLQEGEKKDSSNGKSGGKESNGKSGSGGGGKEGKEGDGPDFGKSFPPRPTATSDDVRLSCRKMIANALRGKPKYIQCDIQIFRDKTTFFYIIKSFQYLLSKQVKQVMYARD